MALALWLSGIQSRSVASESPLFPERRSDAQTALAIRLSQRGNVRRLMNKTWICILSCGQTGPDRAQWHPAVCRDHSALFTRCRITNCQVVSRTRTWWSLVFVVAVSLHKCARRSNFMNFFEINTGRVHIHTDRFLRVGPQPLDLETLSWTRERPFPFSGEFSTRMVRKKAPSWCRESFSSCMGSDIHASTGFMKWVKNGPILSLVHVCGTFHHCELCLRQTCSIGCSFIHNGPLSDFSFWQVLGFLPEENG